jgi:hypothetical protein
LPECWLWSPRAMSASTLTPREAKLRVAIIGAGPAGLAAAHAASNVGAAIKIYAPFRKTPQRGPIMLHRPIPGINTEQPYGYVRQIVLGGSILDYRLRTYGDVNIAINGDILEPGFHTWPVRAAYGKMWDLYSKCIIDRMLYPGDIDSICKENDLVVNTAPIRDLCLEPRRHVFRSFPVALVFKYSYPDQPPNTVIYNAREDIDWVRSSRIFEDEVTEYQIESTKPREGYFSLVEPDLVIHKPLSTTCDCHPRMLRTGRFGKWHNETWIDHAYYETLTTLVSMDRQAEWDRVK